MLKQNFVVALTLVLGSLSSAAADSGVRLTPGDTAFVHNVLMSKKSWQHPGDVYSGIQVMCSGAMDLSRARCQFLMGGNLFNRVEVVGPDAARMQTLLNAASPDSTNRFTLENCGPSACTIMARSSGGAA